MGENEAGLPNMALQGKCQQPLNCSQSETSVILLSLCAHARLLLPFVQVSELYSEVSRGWGGEEEIVTDVEKECLDCYAHSCNKQNHKCSGE